MILKARARTHQLLTMVSHEYMLWRIVACVFLVLCAALMLRNTSSASGFLHCQSDRSSALPVVYGVKSIAKAPRGSRGIVLLAFGKLDYMCVAVAAALNYREQGVTDDIAIMTDANLTSEAVKTQLRRLPPNCSVIPVSPIAEARSRNWDFDFSNAYATGGSIPKLLVPLLTPFEDTLHLDSDLRLRRSAGDWDIWTLFKSPHETAGGLVISGLADANNLGPPTWHFNHLHDVVERVGFAVPQVCSSMQLMRKKWHLTLHVMFQRSGALHYVCGSCMEIVRRSTGAALRLGRACIMHLRCSFCFGESFSYIYTFSSPPHCLLHTLQRYYCR